MNGLDAGLKARTTRSALSGRSSFSSKAEAHPGAEVGPQSGISQHLVVVIVQRIIHVRVSGDVVTDGVPAAEIEAGITRGMVDGRNVSEEEVGVRALSDCGDAKKSSPALPGISQQQHARLLGTPQQWSPHAVDTRIATRIGIARRRLLNLDRKSTRLNSS